MKTQWLFILAAITAYSAGEVRIFYPPLSTVTNSLGALCTSSVVCFPYIELHRQYSIDSVQRHCHDQQSLQLAKYPVVLHSVAPYRTKSNWICLQLLISVLSTVMKASDPTTAHHVDSSYRLITPPTEQQHATVHRHSRAIAYGSIQV
jgi:hypothetical protein